MCVLFARAEVAHKVEDTIRVTLGMKGGKPGQAPSPSCVPVALPAQLAQQSIREDLFHTQDTSLDHNSELAQQTKAHMLREHIWNLLGRKAAIERDMTSKPTLAFTSLISMPSQNTTMTSSVWVTPHLTALM